MHRAARTRALRLRAQGLTGPRLGGATEVLERLVAIQAQELDFARLAFRPRRGPRAVAADVDRALGRRELVWTWALRGTLHLVRAEDVGWLLGLLGPIFSARGRPRRLALGLDDALCERSLARLREMLTGAAPMTRSAIVDRMRGIDPEGQAGAHLLAYAALRGSCAACPRRADASRRSPCSTTGSARRRRPRSPRTSRSPSSGGATSRATPRRSRRISRPGRGSACAARGGRAPPRRARAAMDASAPASARTWPCSGTSMPISWATRRAISSSTRASRSASRPAAASSGRRCSSTGAWQELGGATAGRRRLELFEPLADDVIEALRGERGDVARYLADTR